MGFSDVFKDDVLKGMVREPEGRGKGRVDGSFLLPTNTSSGWKQPRFMIPWCVVCDVLQASLNGNFCSFGMYYIIDDRHFKRQFLTELFEN